MVYRKTFKRYRKRGYAARGSVFARMRGRHLSRFEQVRSNISKGLTNNTNNKHHIKRHTSTIGIYTGSIDSTAVDTGGAFSFRLNDLPNFAELQALFDNYQINCVVIKLSPVRVQQMNEVTTPANYEVPRFYWAWDYDDDTVPTTVAQLQQYATCKEATFTDTIYIKVYPKVSLTAYQTGITSAYIRPSAKLQKMLLNDCAYPDTPYYGIKWMISSPGASTAGLYRYKIDATYYLTMTGII